MRRDIPKYYLIACTIQACGRESIWENRYMDLQEVTDVLN